MNCNPDLLGRSASRGRLRAVRLSARLLPRMLESLRHEQDNRWPGGPIAFSLLFFCPWIFMYGGVAAVMYDVNQALALESIINMLPKSCNHGPPLQCPFLWLYRGLFRALERVVLTIV